MVKKRKRSRPKPTVTFTRACDQVEAILKGTTRRNIVAACAKPPRFRAALTELANSMRANLFQTGSGQVSLERTVRALDKRTREDGFHVLTDWDGTAEKFNEETIPVDVALFLMDMPEPQKSKETVIAILLDYYFFYVLALLSLRAWDEGSHEGSADKNFDRLTRLLEELHGPDGSGHFFVSNAETLILIATAHFEYDVSAYDRLLAKVGTLNLEHRTRHALAHAAILGSHLRFGFETNYERDIIKMRIDNVPDYPQVLSALATLMEAYTHLREDGTESDAHDTIVEGLLNGLSTDPRAFVGTPPSSLEPYADMVSSFHERFSEYRDDLLKAFEEQRPSADTYSPVALYFNFPHNVLKAIVVDALLREEPWPLTLNDLLTGIPRDKASSDARTTLARMLMSYARASPDTIAGHLRPVIVYDPRKGHRDFVNTVRKIME